MSGTAISSLVGGIFDGMDWREARDDKKRRRKIEDEQLATGREDRARRQKIEDERLQWERSDRSRQEAERAQASSLRDQELEIWKSGGGIKDAIAPAAPAAAVAPVTVETLPPAPVAPAGPSALVEQAAPAMVQPQAATQAPATGITVATLPPPAAAEEPTFEEWRAMDEAERARAGLPTSEIGGQWKYRNRDGGWDIFGRSDKEIEAARQKNREITEVDPSRSAFVQGIQADQRDGEIKTELKGISNQIRFGTHGVSGGTVESFVGGIKDYFTGTPEQGAKNAAERERATAALGWYGSDEARAHFSQRPQDLAAAKADPVGYFEGLQASPATPQASGTLPEGAALAEMARVMPGLLRGEGIKGVVGTSPTAATPPAQPAGPSAVSPSAAPASAPPVTPQGTPMQSVAAADEVVAGVKNAISAPNAPTPTKADAGSAVERLTDHVRTNVAPKLLDFYVQSGQIEKAQAFAAFLDDEKVKEGMRKWAGVVSSAAMGDESGFERAIVEAYNAPGYYDDGYSALSASLTKGKDGSVTGAAVKTSISIRYRNDATGEVFERAYEDVGDLYAEAVRLLSPEAVFEEGYASHQQAVAYEQSLATAKAEAQARGLDFGEVMKTVETLGKSSIEFGQLPAEDQVARAIELMSRGTGASQLPPSDAPPGVKFGLGEVAVLRQYHSPSNMEYKPLRGAPAS